MKKYHFISAALLTLGISACSFNQPVAVVKGDKNVDYSATKTIHISESPTTDIKPMVNVVEKK